MSIVMFIMSLFILTLLFITGGVFLFSKDSNHKAVAVMATIAGSAIIGVMLAALIVVSRAL